MSFTYLLVSLVSCKVWNPNKIISDSNDYDVLSSSSLLNESMENALCVGDMLAMVVLTNNGYKMVDAGLAGSSGGNLQSAALRYPIMPSGYVRLPLLDTVYVLGLNLSDAERMIERKYSDHLVQPWVQLQVVNRRAIVYKGDGQAVVVELTNEYMSLLEVVAASGGIPPTSKAYSAKLIRLNVELGSYSLYRVNLRKADSALANNIVVKPNDIIVIDSTFETTFLSQLTPFFAFLTSAIAVYGLFRTFQ
jgi:polysaccharide export outer membrane protein